MLYRGGGNRTVKEREYSQEGAPSAGDSTVCLQADGNGQQRKKLNEGEKGELLDRGLE